MVFKGRFVIFFIFVMVLFILAFIHKGYVETNMLKTLLPKNISNVAEIVNLADKTASVIKVVISENDDSNLKKEFVSQIDKNYFEVDDYDTLEVINQYLKAPANFLSEETRKLLKNKKYDEVYNQAMERLYSPIQISSLDKDPYLFFDDFINSLLPKKAGAAEENSQNYSYLTVKIKNEEGLSPDLSNKKIGELIALQKELSKNGNKIYLAGSPIHSYYTSQKSIIDINVICILSTLMIIFLTYFYFRRYRLLIPIAMAIIFGMLVGYVATEIWFNGFQIITMVFSTTLIGIGIDYSYHYYFSENNKSFFKNLSFSLVTTIIPFVLLYMTGIELLKQISVFTSAGLIAIYLIVLYIYPSFEKSNPVKTIQIKRVYIKYALIFLCVLSLLGFFRFKFNNTLSSMYSPSKKLMTAETLYNKVSGNINGETQFITVSGKNEQDLLEKEEKITSELEEQNINFTALSKFVPSEKKQKENYELVQELYKSNLYKYENILTSSQIQELKNTKFLPINFDTAYPLKGFIIGKNKTVIVIPAEKKLDFENVINIQADIGNYLKNYSIKLVKIFPAVFLILVIVLSLNYGLKSGLKILTPSLCGIITSTGLALLINGEINVFSLIALFMVLGFTMDYSIFRNSREKQTEDAVLVSAATTTFSFLLLSLCGFKLLSSISLILFFGILISYFVGYLVFNNKK